MLRTRVNVTLERQNSDLLASMDRRARLQLRLQQMVEGLSVVAISYYAAGIFAYGLKALQSAGFAFNPDLALGAALPPIVIAVWLAIRRMRRSAGRN